jgi:hypothetical protein
MRIINAVSGRPNYFDRNPIDASLISLQPGLAPHGDANRVSYTVPSNRKALVAAIIHNVKRVTVAGTPGEYDAWVPLMTGGATVVSRMHLREIANTANTYFRDRAAINEVKKAGDTIEIHDQDASVTGTVDFMTSVLVTEFDA